jgi:LysM repeat protein
MRTTGLAVLALLATGVAATVASCSDDGGGSSGPTLPPILTTSTLAPPTTMNPIDQRQFYTVVPGDNLSGIAVRFGVTQESLMALNGITDPDAIAVGQVLQLPAEAFVQTTVPSSSGPSPTDAP